MYKKFNKFLAIEIVDYYSSGLPLNYIAKILDISVMSIWRWRRRGKEEGDGEYYYFYIDMEWAKAMFMLKHIDCLKKSGEDPAFMYLLAVSDYKHYGEGYIDYRKENRDCKRSVYESFN